MWCLKFIRIVCVQIIRGWGSTHMYSSVYVQWSLWCSNSIWFLAVENFTLRCLKARLHYSYAPYFALHCRYNKYHLMVFKFS